MSYLDYERTREERNMVEAAVALYRMSSRMEIYFTQLPQHSALAAPTDVVDRFVRTAQELIQAVTGDEE